MSKKYDASSIEVIELDRDRVRENPILYIPDRKLTGCVHLIREIKDNSDDEGMIQKEKKNKIVKVYYDENTREIIVKDKGRGIPHEKLKDLCEVLHSSGKFNKGDDSAYKYSSGLNGVGLKITNFLSEYLEVISIINHQGLSRYYENGYFIKETKKKYPDYEHGTIVRFKISDECMKETGKVKCKNIQKMIEEKADACPGLISEFHGINKDGKKIDKTYIGLTIDELLEKYNKPTSKTWNFDFNVPEAGSLSCRFAFGYDAKAIEGSHMMGWTNFIYNEDGGTHIDAIVDALYDTFSKYMKKNFLSDKEKKNIQIKKEDIRLGLCSVIVILTTKKDIFYGQYKNQVIDDEIGDVIFKELKKKLNKLSDSDMKIISTIIKNNIKARMSSQRARASVKKVGNGLSKDKIDKYYPAKMRCETDYRELYLTEGLSAGSQAEKSRYDFQEIYMLRGKVDNIYDMSIQELSKIDIIDDLSRIIGIVPGKMSNVNMKHSRIIGLTDADPDGLAIRAGLVLIFAIAFPQVIQEGRLYMVEPPLFGFKENGKMVFKSTNREYLTYLQEKFAKKNNLYFKDHKFKNSEIIDFLLKNERYIEFLKNVSDSNVCSPIFTELVISNINEIGIDKKAINSWNKLMSNKFSKQIKAEWNDNRIILSGIKDGRYEMIELDESLLKSKKTRKLIDLMNQNLLNIHGYSIDGESTYNDISLYQVLKIFNKYKVDSLKRFKGLGEMDADDLRDTCMNLKNQRCVQIKFSDVDKSIRLLANWHSKKEQYRTFRREFMINYEPDLREIST